MGKVRKGIGVFLWLISLISVCAVVCRSLFNINFFKEKEESVEESIPDGVPTIEWNNVSPEKSYEELSVLLSNMESEVVVLNCDVNPEWEDVCMENFWVDSFNISGVNGGKVKTFNFKFKDDAADNKEMQAQVEKEADEIIALIPENASDYEKTLIIHDELIKRIEYDESVRLKHSHDIYGAFVDHRAVCQGYTYAMVYIAKRIGLKCEELSSQTHIWNKMPGFDSGECYIDITWDDIDRSDANGDPYVIHDNFGLSKEEMERLSEHQPLGDEKDSTVKGSVGDNFFKRNGWYIPKGDTAVLELAVKEQLESGSNTVELRFEDKADYASARDTVEEMLRRMGYKDAYISWQNESLLIYTVGLNPPTDE